MMKIIVKSLPEIDFVIDKKEKVARLLSMEKNVYLLEEREMSGYPKLVVTGSGFMVNSKQALIYELISFLTRKNPGDYCLGCNIEPLKGCLSKFLIKRKLNKFKLIVCRDKESLLWFEKNVKKPKVEYLPDILFSLPEEYVRREKKGKNLGISLMHRTGDRTDCDYYKKMAEIADFWVEKKKENVMLMAFDSGIEDDVFACNCVKKMMKYSENAEIIIHRNGGEIFDAYSECEKIIATRYHSAVLASRMGKDMYPVIYRDKMKNLLKDINFPVKGCMIDAIDVESIKKFILSEKLNFSLDSEFFKKSDDYSEILRDYIKLEK